MKKRSRGVIIGALVLTLVCTFTFCFLFSTYILLNIKKPLIREKYIDKITTLCYYDLIKRKERSYAEIIPCNSI